MPGRLRGAFLLPVVVLVLAAPRTSADEIAGTYQHAGTTTATLEIRRQANDYLVRLEGGASSAAGAATPADCVIEARGRPEGQVLRARFGPVETETFAYDEAQSESEARFVEIVFGPGSARVVQADTLGYCGLEVDFVGAYRNVAQISWHCVGSGALGGRVPAGPAQIGGTGHQSDEKDPGADQG